MSLTSSHMLLHLLTAASGTFETFRDVRTLVTIEGKADTETNYRYTS